MTKLYLAYSTAGHTSLSLYEKPVDLLVAFPMLAGYAKRCAEYPVQEWVLDSGAFTAFNSGKVIDLDEYIATCLSCDAHEVFGLDVIGDPTATRKNNEYMWSKGVEAIPTFHFGSPWSALDDIMHRPKIALGGVARRRGGEVRK